MRKLRCGESREIVEEMQPGEVFIVKRFNGTIDEKVVATLIETKEVCDKVLQQNRDEKKEKNLVKPGTEQTVLVMNDDQVDSRVSGDSPTKRMHKLYYIHYEGMDRRMDEWVERERFVEYAPVGASLIAPVIATIPGGENTSGTITRSQRRIHEEFHHVQKGYGDMDAFTAKLEKEHEERTKVKNIQNVTFGPYDISTWYFSPFPDECAKQERLFICEYCLIYTPVREQYACHRKHLCKVRQPPGSEIYRSGNLSVFEVDGRANKIYCQCLCLLSKLFMDHKTLYYDVDTFLFYVLCEVDDNGAHLVGHFSKERMSVNNLACIMILPPFQRNGYGKLLIQLSYELSAREGWIGTPEKPLSDLGKVSYRSYWWWVLLEVMDDMKVEDITVTELSYASGISCADIVSTLQTMQMVKYWKGDHVVRTNRRMIEHCKSLNMARAPKVRLDKDALRWTPREMRGSPRGSID